MKRWFEIEWPDGWNDMRIADLQGLLSSSGSAEYDGWEGYEVLRMAESVPPEIEELIDFDGASSSLPKGAYVSVILVKQTLTGPERPPA